MFEILEKKVWLAEEPRIVEFLVKAPDIARAHHAGQFVIVIPVEGGERIPLTIADSDAKAGTISLVFQEVGASTIMLGRLEKGQKIPHVAGPLGKPTHIEKFDGAVVCVGGGIGIAPIHPIAKAMKAAGNHVISILGARSKNLMIYEERMKLASSEIRITTDDGSYGKKGFVTDELKGIIEGGTKVGCAVVIGPPIMMKFTCKVTEPLQDPDVRQPEHDHGRRHRDVRRLPRDGRRQDQVRLRGRPGVRRAPGGLRRDDGAPAAVPPRGEAGEGPLPERPRHLPQGLTGKRRGRRDDD